MKSIQGLRLIEWWPRSYQGSRLKGRTWNEALEGSMECYKYPLITAYECVEILGFKKLYCNLFSLLSF